MRNIVPWIGGKTLLAMKIVSLFPEKVERYVEVFGGGASVLLSKEKLAPFEVYNDADSQIVNLFRCVKYHRGELQKEISKMKTDIKNGKQPVFDNLDSLFDALEK